MIHRHRDEKTTFFYFKTDAGKLPQELTGWFTDQVLADKALELYQMKVQATAEKNSAQVRKAKAKAQEKVQEQVNAADDNTEDTSGVTASDGAAN